MKCKNRNRHEFLLTFFNPEPTYQEKEVHGFILVKYFSNNTHEWEVMIYSKESFNNRQNYLDYKKTVPAPEPFNKEQTTIYDKMVEVSPAELQSRIGNAVSDVGKPDRRRSRRASRRN